MNETYLYILECCDKSLYTGITYNITKRLLEHGRGLCKYTRGRLPVRVVYTETYSNRKDAARREYEIKGWKRDKKLKLVSLR